MIIASLSPPLVRALGSSLVLSDSASVVKELIDNALDAKASSISIEISPNTLDVIQVRDNGHGVHLPDREMLCSLHSTSKISNMNDLSELGGTSLGFRGVALASVAEMSGVLQISSRTEGESVAEMLRFNREGKVIGRERCSHQTGTTVRISDFLYSLPVRRQVLLKNAGKTLCKLRRLVIAYALARPAIRFALKILKAKLDAANIVYAPVSEGNVKDAALKLVGSGTIAQCEWRSSLHPEGNNVEPILQGVCLENPKFIFDALLPKVAANFSHLNHQGQFISIDHRPISLSGGTAKRIIKIFKFLLGTSKECSTAVIDPFLFLNVRCPRGSYDINIEPAKDDVLFVDEAHFMNACDNFFQSVYGNVGKETSDQRWTDVKSSHSFGLAVHGASRDRGQEDRVSGRSNLPEKELWSIPINSTQREKEIDDHTLLPSTEINQNPIISTPSSPYDCLPIDRSHIQKSFQVSSPREVQVESSSHDDRDMLDTTVEEEIEHFEFGSRRMNPRSIARTKYYAPAQLLSNNKTAIRSYGDLMTPRRQLGDYGGECSPSISSLKLHLNSNVPNLQQRTLKVAHRQPISPYPTEEDQSPNLWTPVNRTRAVECSSNRSPSGGTALETIPSVLAQSRTRKPKVKETALTSSPPIQDRNQTTLSQYLVKSSSQKPPPAQNFQRVRQAELPMLSGPLADSRSSLRDFPAINNGLEEIVLSRPAPIISGEGSPAILRKQDPRIFRRSLSDLSCNILAACPQRALSLLSTDPRHYLLTLQAEGNEGGRDRTPADPKKLRRRETAKLPLETMTETQKLRALRFVLSAAAVDEENIKRMVEKIRDVDAYARSGDGMLLGFSDAPRVSAEFRSAVEGLLRAKCQKEK